MKSDAWAQQWAKVTRVNRDVTLGLSAFAVGAIGEILLLTRPRPVGAGLLVIAAAIAALAWGKSEEPYPSIAVTQNKSVATKRALSQATKWRLAGIISALTLSLGGMLAWAADPGALFGWQGILWLASIALFVASCVGWYVGESKPGPAEPAWTRVETAGLAGITTLALVTHLTLLNDVPWHFHYDEVLANLEALRFYKGPAISIFSTTWYGTSMPSLPFVLTGNMMHLAGTGLAGTRFGVALVGALMVVPIYGLARLVFGRTAAFLAAIGWATTAVAIHYTRISIIDILAALGYLCCFVFLLRGLRAGRIVDFAWAGVAAGLSMYIFYSDRLLPFVLAIFCAYLLVVHRKAMSERMGGFALLPVGFVVGFGPLLAYFIRNSDLWLSRGLVELSVPQLFPLTLDGWLSNLKTFALLTWENFLGLSVIPTNDHDYWAPFLFPTEAVVLLLGVGVLVRRWKEPGAFLILLWGASVLFVGGTLISYERIPAFVHWTAAFPVFFMIMALPPALLVKSLGNVSPGWRLVGTTIVGIWIAGLAVANIYTYLVTYPARVPPAFEVSQGRYLAILEPHDRVRFVGYSWQGYYPAMGAMMAPEVVASDLFNPSRSLPLPDDLQHDLVFVFNSDEVQYLPLVRSYYPGGRVEIMDADGGPIARRYVLSADDATQRYGVVLSLSDAVREVWHGQVKGIGELPSGPISVTYPLTATWSGAFFMHSTTTLELLVENGADDKLWLQGDPTVFGQSQSLDHGWVPFVLQAHLDKPEPLHLLLKIGSGQPAEIPANDLWPAVQGEGLAATFNGVDVSHRIDLSVGAGVLGGAGDITPTEVISTFSQRDPDLLALAPPTTGRARIRWEGELLADGGAYTMELRTDAHALLRIDDNLTLDLCATTPANPYSVIAGGIPPVIGKIDLSPGWHKVRLDYEATGNINGLEWTWTRPDGVREIVPPERLRYSEGHGVSPVVWPDTPGAISCAR